MDREGTERGSGVLLAMNLMWRASPLRSSGFALLVLWSGVQGVLFVLAGGWLISSLEEIQGSPTTPEVRRVIGLAVLVVVLFLVPTPLRPFAERLGTSLSFRFHQLLQRMLFRASSRPMEIGHLEDSQVADRFAAARGELSGLPPRRFVARLYQIAPGYISAVVFAFILATFEWWAPLIIAIGVVFERVWVSKELKTTASAYEVDSQGLRRAGYFRDLALDPLAAKELRVFGIQDWLTRRFRDQWVKSMERVWLERRGHRLIALTAILVIASSYGFIVLMIGRAGLQGEIQIGDVAIFLGAALGMAAVVWQADPEVGLRLAARAVKHAVSLHEEFGSTRALPQTLDSSRSQQSGGPGPHGNLKFESVGFTYPGTSREVLKDISFEIKSGTSLAIVGRNGAGKTSLIKLLCRLYEPTRGQVFFGDKEIGDIPSEQWRRELAVIFQDFTRYELTVGENIGLGAPPSHRDKDSLDRAVQRAGASEVIENLPLGMDTIASRQYRDGIELSGGQWQRIALSRCFAAVEAGARLLVLDEPTAALDVRGEAELFDRFLDVTRGLTTILVSHRFSTVRRADRIIVVEEGRVIEFGTHEELMQLRGRYSEMFDLQAARFQD